MTTNHPSRDPMEIMMGTEEPSNPNPMPRQLITGQDDREEGLTPPWIEAPDEKREYFGSHDPMKMMAETEDLPQRKNDSPSPSAQEIRRWWNRPA